MPYRGSRMFMAVLLPDEISGLSTLEETPTTAMLSDLLSNMGEPTAVNLQLPKSKIEQTTNLKKNLESMGIRDLFSDNADLSGINVKGNLKVSDAVHKRLLLKSTKKEQRLLLFQPL